MSTQALEDFVDTDELMTGVYFHIRNVNGQYLDPSTLKATSTTRPTNMWYYIGTTAQTVVTSGTRPKSLLGGLLCPGVDESPVNFSPPHIFTPSSGRILASDFELEFDVTFTSADTDMRIASTTGEYVIEISRNTDSLSFKMTFYASPDTNEVSFKDFIAGRANSQSGTSGISGMFYLAAGNGSTKNFNLKLSKIGTVVYLVAVDTDSTELAVTYLNFKDLNRQIDIVNLSDSFSLNFLSGPQVRNFIFRTCIYSRSVINYGNKLVIANTNTYNTDYPMENCFSYDIVDKTIYSFPRPLPPGVIELTPGSSAGTVINSNGDIVSKVNPVTPDTQWHISVKTVKDSWPFSIEGIWQSRKTLMRFKETTFRSSSGTYEVYVIETQSGHFLRTQTGTYSRPGPDLISFDQGFTATINLRSNTFKDTCGNVFISVVRIPWYPDIGGAWEYDTGTWTSDNKTYFKCPFGSVNSNIPGLIYTENTSTPAPITVVLNRSNYDKIQSNIRFRLNYDLNLGLLENNTAFLFDCIHSAYPINMEITQGTDKVSFHIDVYAFVGFVPSGLYTTISSDYTFYKAHLDFTTGAVDAKNFVKYSIDFIASPNISNIMFMVEYGRDGKKRQAFNATEYGTNITDSSITLPNATPLEMTVPAGWDIPTQGTYSLKFPSNDYDRSRRMIFNSYSYYGGVLNGNIYWQWMFGNDGGDGFTYSNTDKKIKTFANGNYIRVDENTINQETTGTVWIRTG